uniref:Secreted protein n=1 Tax=Caenorhabditis tropicalis TaxID=1561998 RepID=A0A1I7UIP8_9PELO
MTLSSHAALHHVSNVPTTHLQSNAEKISAPPIVTFKQSTSTPQLTPPISRVNQSAQRQTAGVVSLPSDIPLGW